MAVPSKELHAYQARLATFQAPHHLSKRRASAQNKKKGGNAIEWPHEKPAPERLASAGFFYRPSHNSPDNVQCFLCTVKLDGWEATDDPIQEHLAHSEQCAWAKTISVDRPQGDEREAELRDPMSDEMLNARKATFTTGDGWPHENKKGWKCKVNKMLDAGWAWDPAGEGEDGDGVTCFYCNLSLDGWEPKDDPFEEHKRRSPGCRFFQLLEHYYGADAANGKMKKTKGRGNTSSRISSTSKTSRISTQSTISTALSIPGSVDDALEDGTMAGVDDSILTTATDVSRATTTGSKGKKKTTRTKAAAKGAKGKKKTLTGSNNEDEISLQDADVSQNQALRESPVLPSQSQPEEPPASTLPKADKRGTRASKQVDSSVVEISQLETAPPKKATRSRKAKDEKQPEWKPPSLPETPDAGVIAQKRSSEVSAQLQDELEHSVGNFEPLDESTPLAQPVKPKRGVKRTSDGMRKQPEVHSSVAEAEVPTPTNAKSKRSRAKKASAASTEVDHEGLAPEVQKPLLDFPHIETVLVSETDKVRPKRTKASKVPSTRSSRSSKGTATAPEPEPSVDEPEDHARDDMEIEQELERIASEQSPPPALQSEQDQMQELETSQFQGHVEKENVEAECDKVSEKDFASPPRQLKISGSFTPSPSGSDKENQPSPTGQSSAKHPQPPIALTATKTLRIPLAASTPNRSPTRSLMSPSKHVSHLTSVAAWKAVDLDHVLLASPQPTPGKLGQQLVAAAGALTSPEKRMSVEEWVRHRAERGEEELRRRCEQMVAAFENEGMRGLECLNGINLVG